MIFLKKNIPILVNIQSIFKIFLVLWIVFIPMKTIFYVIGYVGIILLFLYYIFKYKRYNAFLDLISKYKTTIIFFSLIILSMTISNIISHYTSFISWRVELNYIFRYFLIFLILLFLYYEKFFTKKFILVTILSSLSIQAVDALFYQSFFHYDLFKHHYGTLQKGLSGGVFYRNPFGMFMAIGASLTLGLLHYNQIFHINKKEKLTILFIFILFLFGLLFSYSRASWLFFLTYTIIFYSLNYKNLQVKHIITFLLCILILSLLFYYNGNLHDRLMLLLEGNSSHRFEIWSNTLSLIKENIIFGYGLMTAWALHLKPDPSVHNSILEILLFLGIFGFIAYTILLWHILKTCIKNNDKIQTALFFAFLVITQFDDSIIKSIVTLSSLSIFAFFIFTKQNDNTNLSQQ